MTRGITLLVAVAGLLTGCGGKVVFVEDDGSGASGAGGAGPGPGPGSGPGQTNSSTGVGIATACESYCSTWGTCDLGSDCISQCEGSFTGVCDAELADVLTCLSNNFTSCDFTPEVCVPLFDAYSSCIEPPSDCFTEFCDNGPDGSCYCSGICFDEITLEQQCFFPVPGDGNGGQPGDPPPPPQTTCDCFLDGSYIGSCDNFELACSIEEGCCQFLVGGGE